MKLFRLFHVLLSGCLLFALGACSKTQLTEQTSATLSASGRSVSFVASFERPVPDSPDSKVVITEGEGQTRNPVWEAGDAIKIFYKDPATSKMTSTLGTAEVPGAETTFAATLPEGVTAFYAVYPSSLTSSVDEDGNFSVTMKTDNNDEATFANACICIAKSGPEKQFRFKNLCSMLKFKLVDKGSILQICSLDGTPVDGTIAASIDADGNVAYASTPFTATHYARQMKKVSADNTVCYIPILPGVQAAGIAINHLATYTAPAAFATRSIAFERSHIYNLDVVDEHIVKDYYFTESGAGDKSGLSWDNAGDIETFKEIVAFKEGNNMGVARYLQIWKTKGVSFHFAAGKYVLGDSGRERLAIDFYGADGAVYSEMNIQGGYPASGGDTPDPDTYVTTFSGDGTYGILGVYDRARVHIDGVTFADAYSNNNCTSDNTIARGAALYLKDRSASNAGSQEAERKSAPRVWLSRCKFIGNRTVDEVSKVGAYAGGSAINIANGAVYADRCEFRNNYDKGASGCIRLSGAAEKEYLVSYAFFNSCLFTGNTVGTYNAAYGSVIQHNRKGALLGLYNCTLYNNNESAPESQRYGWNIVNFERSGIVANTTIIDNMYSSSNADAPGYGIRVATSNGLNHFIFANNLVMNTAAATGTANRGYTFVGPSGTATSTSKLFMEGGSVFGLWQAGYGNVTYVSVTPANEYGTGTGAQAMAYSDLDNPSFDGKLFKWNGSLKGGTVSCGFMSGEIMVEKVLKSANINQTDSYSKLTFSTTGAAGETAYEGFYHWLNALGAIDSDASGASRPAVGWTPGAYQKQ